MQSKPFCPVTHTHTHTHTHTRTHTYTHTYILGNRRMSHSASVIHTRTHAELVVLAALRPWRRHVAGGDGLLFTASRAPRQWGASTNHRWTFITLLENTEWEKERKFEGNSEKETKDDKHTRWDRRRKWRLREKLEETWSEMKRDVWKKEEIKEKS